MKSLSILFIHLLVSVSTFAQGDARGRGRGNGSGEGRAQIAPEELAKKQTEKFTTKINLTPDQIPQVYQLNLNRIQAFRTAKTTRPFNKELFVEAIKIYKDGMKKVLTPAQIEQLKAMKKEHQEMRNQRESQNRGNNAPNPNNQSDDKSKKQKTDKKDNKEEEMDDEPDFDL